MLILALDFGTNYVFRTHVEGPAASIVVGKHEFVAVLGDLWKHV